MRLKHEKVFSILVNVFDILINKSWITFLFNFFILILSVKRHKTNTEQEEKLNIKEMGDVLSGNKKYIFIIDSVII